MFYRIKNFKKPKIKNFLKKNKKKIKINSMHGLQKMEVLGDLREALGWPKFLGCATIKINGRLKL